MKIQQDKKRPTNKANKKISSLSSQGWTSNQVLVKCIDMKATWANTR